MNAPALQASNLDTTLQQAFRHHQAGQLREAEQLYHRILQSQPSHAETNHLLGLILKDQGKVAEATAAFRRVVAAAPGAPAAHNNLGTILFSQGQLDEAEAAYRRALELKPDMNDALKNLGLVLVDNGRAAESVEWFRRHAELTFGRPGGIAGHPVPPHKAQHDREQCDYLGNGKPACNTTIFNLEEGARLAGRAVNPDRSQGEIEAQWQTGSPQYVVIDDLLTDEGLEALRRYCWRSTIWHSAHANGYVRSMPEHGFACPLLAQIDEELRSTYPVILGRHPLLRWWAFKYDGKLRGTNVHADFAAVNINFWIAPDEANLDPDSGGLVIWDKTAPLDWGFAQYNGASQSVRDFLNQSGARPVTVPHRANRAVIFDSDLFHETDRISFKDGYLNRRINITMLYGRRGEATPNSK